MCVEVGKTDPHDGTGMHFHVNEYSNLLEALTERALVEVTVEGQRKKKKRKPKKKKKNNNNNSFYRTCYLATLERTHDGSLAVGCSYSSLRAVTHLLTALGGNAAAVPRVDGEGPAFRNFTIVHYRQEFEVGERLL